jgi:predicted transcriptional regulator of viral defense system
MHICIIYEYRNMARKSKFDTILPDIEAYLDNFPVKAYTTGRLRDILNNNPAFKEISTGSNFSKLIDFLADRKMLHRNNFTTAENEVSTLYTWKVNDEFTAISGLKSNAYFVFFSALFLNRLTLQIPKTVYLNFERARSEKALDKQEPLTQEKIDQAFAGNQRKSNATYSFGDKNIVLVNGKFTNRLGVIKSQDPGQAFEYTDLERTLIDIAVRPVYSGGVFDVLDAYRNAKDRLDVDKLSMYLGQLDYLYPYHQVIGFYLDKAGYPEEAYLSFRKEMTFRFYLTYNIRIKDFSEKWNLYYPRGL